MLFRGCEVVVAFLCALAPEHKVVWQFSPFRMGKRYQTVTENTKPSQRSPKCFCNLGVKFCLVCTCVPVAGGRGECVPRSGREWLCSSVESCHVLSVRGTWCWLVRLGWEPEGGWALCSPVQSPKPYPVLLPQFFCSVSNTPCKVMGLVLAFARGASWRWNKILGRRILLHWANQQWSGANLASKAAEEFPRRHSPRSHLFMCHAVLTISFHLSVATPRPTQLQIRTVG